jgi:hypothetical protein
MKASFHQRFGLARSDESDCFICRIVAVRRVDYPEWGKVGS